MQNKVLICLGSNSDCEANIRSAGNLLRDYFDSARFSEPVYTEPVGLPGSGFFLNQVVVAYTDHWLEEVELSLKRIERQLGRVPESKKKGIIPLDIDLLQWNDRVLKPDDLRRDYVRKGLDSILSADVG